MKMISKELFLSIIEKIKKQSEKDSKLSDALSDYACSYIVIDQNLHIGSILSIMKDLFDPYEYISWWLYESVEKKVWLKDGTEIDLTTPEQLYDFLKNEVDNQ